MCCVMQQCRKKNMVETEKTEHNQEQSSPHKNRPYKKPETDLYDFKCITEYTVNEFHLSKKQQHTLKRIMLYWIINFSQTLFFS